ncbi:hypothetical protein PND99_13275, partial [Flavonifractor plautii]|nr:hypothetical protein [Flavonifractor plautii]
AVHLGPRLRRGGAISAGGRRNSFPAAADEIPGGPREILFRGADGEEYTIVRQGDILAIVE